MSASAVTRALYARGRRRASASSASTFARRASVVCIVVLPMRLAESLRYAGAAAEGMTTDSNSSREPTGFRARPEARWALWAGVAGALATAVWVVKAILRTGGTDATVGYLLVPFIAAIAAIPCGIWGAALGHVVLRLRGVVREPWIGSGPRWLPLRRYLQLSPTSSGENGDCHHFLRGA